MCTHRTQKTIYVLCLFGCHQFFPQADSIRIKKMDSLELSVQLPVFADSQTDDNMEEQELNSLLSSSRDVFVQFATFQFGAARYKIRGASAKDQLVLMNGINMANPETGFASWGNWSGLNDITRYTENQVGNTINVYGFSTQLGYVHIDAKASAYRKGTRISYAYSNRQFKNRFMLTHSTGNLSNGWAFTASASNRSGNLYIPGTYIQASSFYLAADKRINEKHLLSFSAVFTPTERAGSGTEQQEVYDLSETNYYNARWGFQNGKARNASIRNSARPVFFLSHTYQPYKGGHWNSSIAYLSGKTSISGLNWNQSPNPNPDYYRYLPSYYYASGDTLMGDRIKNDWKTDLNTQQINWDQLIKLNQANLYSIPSSSNSSANTSETRARYILENRIEALQQISFNSTYLKRIRKLFSSTGFNATYYSNRKYKIVDDLLGASYWLDYDQFAQGLGIDPNIQQNNLDAPDKKIHEGNQFGYDYRIHIRKAELWSQVEYKIRRLDLYAGASVSGSRVWRESYMANGKFPTTSKGLSEKLNFISYGFKAGATYKLSGRQFFTLNSTYLTRPTTVNNMFIAPDVRNDLISDLKNEKTASTDINYLIKAPGLKLRFTVYFTQVQDVTWLKTYWSDVSNTFINYIMTGVNQQQKGLELGLEKTIFISHNLQCAFGFGNFSYSDRTTAQAWQSNNNAALFSNRTIYLKNYHLGGSPQAVVGFGYRYMSVRRFYVGLNLSYFDQIYAEINPDKRTKEAMGVYAESELDLAQKVLAQEKLPAYYILNANIGKSFRLRKNSGLNVQLSVNNLLNSQNNKLFAAEQLRWDSQYPERFQNKYTYMTGRTYMAQIIMNF